MNCYTKYSVKNCAGEKHCLVLFAWVVPPLAVRKIFWRVIAEAGDQHPKGVPVLLSLLPQCDFIGADSNGGDYFWMMLRETIGIL